MPTTADRLNLLLQTKEDIKQAIIDKGVEVSDTDNFPSYADKISSISSGGSVFSIPDGTSFAYSQWDSIPDAVIDYINTNICGRFLFYFATIAYIPSTLTLIPSEAYSMFEVTKADSVEGYEKITLDCSRLDQLSRTFYNAWFKEVVLTNTSTINRYNSTFYNNSVINILSGMDMILCTEFNNVFYYTNWLFRLSINNLGAVSSLTSVNLSGAIRWGVEMESYPESIGSKQTLISSLITNSYDRITAGYSVCTITLSSNTKVVLTEEEIAQITAKGFTIA